MHPRILLIMALAGVLLGSGPMPPVPAQMPITDFTVSAEYGDGFDFSSNPLPAGGVRADTMLVGNAAQDGDLVWISFAPHSNWAPVDDGMIVQAWVSAPGQVRIVFINATGHTISSMVFTHFRVVHGPPGP